jgi:copper transport protein
VRHVVVALVALGALLAGAGPAAAHAQLNGTDPVDGALLDEAPESVTLTFNEPVRLTDREITVYDADGGTVASAATTSGSDVVVDLPDPGAVERGSFVVAWFVVSADGHPISGSLTFSVGERSDNVAEPPPRPTSSGTVTAVQGVLGIVMYVGLLIATGLAGFVALVLPETFAGELVRRRIRGLVRVAAAAAVVAALLLVPLSAAYAQGEELADVLGGFDPGLVTDELVSAALLLVGLGVVVAATTDTHPDPRRRVMMLVGAAVALLSPTLVGHTRSYQPTALLLAADVVHLLAAATWLGGLVGLVLTMRSLAARELLAATTLARFSALAGSLLFAVALAGTVLGWRILGAWSGFVDTRYGLLLLVKIGLALAVAAVGAWNRFVVLPRVRDAAGFDDRTRTAGSVSRTMAVEASLIVVLLGVTGFLVNASPRPVPVEVPPGRTGVAVETVGDLEVYAGLSPRRQGQNVLQVQVQDQSGEPVTPPRPPVVEVRSGEVDLGAVELATIGVGTYTADVVLPSPGRWEVQVALRTSKFESPVSTLRIDVPDDEE